MDAVDCLVLIKQTFLTLNIFLFFRQVSTKKIKSVKMRALEINPFSGTLREADDWPWQWTTTDIHTYTLSGDLTVAHAEPEDLMPNHKSLRLFNHLFHGVVVVWPTITEVITDQEFAQFHDFIEDHLYFV